MRQGYNKLCGTTDYGTPLPQWMKVPWEGPWCIVFSLGDPTWGGCYKLMTWTILRQLRFYHDTISTTTTVFYDNNDIHEFTTTTALRQLQFGSNYDFTISTITRQVQQQAGADGGAEFHQASCEIIHACRLFSSWVHTSVLHMRLLWTQSHSIRTGIWTSKPTMLAGSSLAFLRWLLPHRLSGSFGNTWLTIHVLSSRDILSACCSWCQFMPSSVCSATCSTKRQYTIRPSEIAMRQL